MKFMYKKLFLDDIRMVKDTYLDPINWFWVKNYIDFINYIKNNYLIITDISFDYDLGEDEARNLVKQGWSKRSARQHKKTVKSGFDCALWCKWFFKEKNIPLPQIHIHSKNPEGKEKLINLFK